jgi:hypothetical protein
MARLRFLIAVVVLGLGVHAQQPAFKTGVDVSQAASRQDRRFATGVDVTLVLIDVNVVDAGGHPVADLSARDFEVLVDRKARPVVSAQFIQYLA